jgi:hypothetical protein
MESLLTKYRPTSFDEILGQDAVVRALSLFAAEPYTTAMLFHGESGIGKTATAHVLARHLGCNVDEGELGGFTEIRSGEMRIDRVERVLELLRFRPLFGNGWKVLICNEADRMGLPVETIWLDALEALPPRTVVIFTTNAVNKLSRRFRDRCEVYHFTSDTETLAPRIRQLAQKIWAAEGLAGEVPGLNSLGMPTLGSFDDMHASFRLALQQLTRFVREAKDGGDLAQVQEQLAADCLPFAADSKQFAAECDHCGHSQAVKPGRKRQKCAACGKSFTLELV